MQERLLGEQVIRGAGSRISGNQDSRDYVGGTRAFFALADLKLNPPAFLKTGVDGARDLELMLDYFEGSE